MLNIGLKMSRQNKADRKKVKRVFCIGNGESRQGFDLEKLRQHGTIYGCNAIYRDFMPDVLTAVDMVSCMRFIMLVWHKKCMLF